MEYMSEFEEQHDALLRNLATHACAARGRLGLSLPDAARLAGLTPDVVGAIETGSDCALPLAALRQWAMFLGLTQCGLPRPRPAGMP